MTSEQGWTPSWKSLSSSSSALDVLGEVAQATARWRRVAAFHALTTAHEAVSAGNLHPFFIIGLFDRFGQVRATDRPGLVHFGVLIA